MGCYCWHLDYSLTEFQHSGMKGQKLLPTNCAISVRIMKLVN